MTTEISVRRLRWSDTGEVFWQGLCEPSGEPDKRIDYGHYHHSEQDEALRCAEGLKSKFDAEGLLSGERTT